MYFLGKICQYRKYCGLIVVAMAAIIPINFACAEEILKKTTHLMAIGICPPWKPQNPEACRRSVDAMESALTARLGIADKNVTTLLNAAATTEGLKAAFAGFSGLGPKDRLIIYANLHAGALDPTAQVGPDNDVFVLWTKDKPAALQFAVAEGDWIMASDFAAWVHALPVGEVILILDACESGAVTPLFIDAHPSDDGSRPEAVIVSASADQIANFSSDRSVALYSQQLAQTLASTEGTFGHAADLAAEQTHNAAIAICDLRKSSLEQAGVDPSSCRQQPTTHDPESLLTQIVLRD